ncbi:unnamed protein product, partial [Ectocarpus sp. 12 AP-2014]
MAEAAAEVNADQEYRFRPFEKTGMAMTADCRGNDRINLEGLSEPNTFMDVEDEDSSDEMDEEGDSSTAATVKGDGDLDTQSQDGASSGDESD